MVFDAILERNRFLDGNRFQLFCPFNIMLVNDIADVPARGLFDLLHFAASLVEAKHKVTDRLMVLHLEEDTLLSSNLDLVVDLMSSGQVQDSSHLVLCFVEVIKVSVRHAKLLLVLIEVVLLLVNSRHLVDDLLLLFFSA